MKSDGGRNPSAFKTKYCPTPPGPNRVVNIEVLDANAQPHLDESNEIILAAVKAMIKKTIFGNWAGTWRKVWIASSVRNYAHI